MQLRLSLEKFTQIADLPDASSADLQKLQDCIDAAEKLKLPADELENSRRVSQLLNERLTLVREFTAVLSFATQVAKDQLLCFWNENSVLLASDYYIMQLQLLFPKYL